jgi:DnaJ-class molecular chaperone
MKRIKQYRDLFEVEANVSLKELKNIYRGLVKEWHPDKFQDEDLKLQAGEKSQEIIDAYHFLVSISSETIESNREEYSKTISTEGIEDYVHKGLRLEITFTNGATYEYFGVNRALFIKFNNSDKQMRFGKRNIFDSFLFRKSKKEAIA